MPGIKFLKIPTNQNILNLYELTIQSVSQSLGMGMSPQDVGMENPNLSTGSDWVESLDCTLPDVLTDDFILLIL